MIPIKMITYCEQNPSLQESTGYMFALISLFILGIPGHRSSCLTVASIAMQPVSSLSALAQRFPPLYLLSDTLHCFCLIHVVI